MVQMRALVFVALMLVHDDGLWAQQAERAVTIRVVSRAGAALDGARVEAGQAFANTDSEGAAVLRVAVGRVELRITRIGFVPATVQVDVPATGDADFTVALDEAAVEAEAIIVTATRANRRIEDEPLRVEVVGREEIEEKLIMTPGDIAMLLNETSGLRVQPANPALGGASVRIQGLRGSYTMMLADGLPLYGAQSGTLGPLQVPPMDLGSVEVIKGAASALYGASALGGVVNLVSRRPNPSREVLLNGTTFGGADGVLWLADELSPRWGYTVLAGAHGQPQTDVDGDGWGDLPGYRRGLVRPRLFWEDGTGGSVFATVGGMMEDRFGGTLPGDTTPAGTSVREDVSTDRVDAGVVARHLADDGRLVTLRGSGAYQANRHTFDTVVEDDRHVTGFGEASVAAANGAHHWVLGAALQIDAYQALDVPGFDFTHTVPGVFVQDEVTLTDAVVVSASARLDHHSAYGLQLHPRLSALLRPRPWTVRASAGSGYVAPTPLTEDVEAVGLSRLDPLPPDLRVERAWTMSLDVGRTVSSVELNATLFAAHIEDPVATIPADSGRLRLINAAGPTRTWGGELLARYHLAPLHITGTYAYTRATEDWEGDRREIPYTPRHAVGVVGAWEHDGGGRVGVEFYYTGLQELEDDPYRTASRPYVIVGFLVERRFGPARVFLNAENLFDARQTRWAPLVRSTQAADGRWTTDVWAPLEGRAFNLGVRLSLQGSSAQLRRRVPARNSRPPQAGRSALGRREARLKPRLGLPLKRRSSVH
jgi:iron complex outermembrane receptor protein